MSVKLEIYGQYVLCEKHDSGIVARADRIEDLVPQWKKSALSLRFETESGWIVDVPEEDYQRANELANPPRKKEAR